MTAWQTHFTLDELMLMKSSAEWFDDDLVRRLDLMISCLGMCQENQIIVTITRE